MQDDEPAPEPSSFRALDPLPVVTEMFPTKSVARSPLTPVLPESSYTSEETIDEETVLANVEEMLEGFEWRGGVSSSGWGGGTGKGQGKADEIEKRLVGELKALEAVSHPSFSWALSIR